jgi:hypothetical protein
MVDTGSVAWRKSSRCGSATCVEVARAGEVVAVRDSKRQDSPILAYSGDSWVAFLAGVKAGEFDLL